MIPTIFRKNNSVRQNILRAAGTDEHNPDKCPDYFSQNIYHPIYFRPHKTAGKHLLFIQKTLASMEDPDLSGNEAAITGIAPYGNNTHKTNI